MSVATTSAHYISGTHWDREWYRPFQEYRLLLVRLLDGLLDLLETSDEFKYFQLDGQTCVLDDYMEIRPQNRPRLERLIREGRILVGPWYTMPDLFCPDDESLLRNLLLGRRISREWGAEPMPVGFTCDMFGHPSQMPQIFAGFGYRDVVLGRGTNEFDSEMYFNWHAPDGSQVLVYKLQDKMGYGAFALPRAILENAEGVAAEQVAGREAYQTDVAAAAGDADKLRAVREKYGKMALANYLDYEVERANLPVVAIMDTMDHIAPASDVGLYLRMLREACESVEPKHSTLPDLFAEARKHAAATTLASKTGELRAPSRERCGYLYLIPNCVSARIGLKRVGDATAAMLERWAEPLVALTEGGGQPVEGGSLQPYLQVAWRQVLANHAHDSVCGCSIDQVHRDMLNRFEQADVIARQVRHQALATLTDDCRELASEKDAFTLALCNPLPFERDDVIIFEIDLPTDFPTEFHEGFRSQSLKSFTLSTADGEPVPYQRLAYVPITSERSRLAKFCFINDGPFTRYTVAARVKLPACGYTSLLVSPSAKPVRLAGSLRTGPAEAENEFIALAVMANGTLRLQDKTTGRTFTDLLTWEDRSEIGDGWFHGHSLNDGQILSTACDARVAVLHDGPLATTFRVTVVMNLPQKYDWHAEAPAEETVPLTIRSDVTLRAGARQVEVSTVVDNCAEDHRLQVLLPTDASGAASYLAHTPYDLVERAIALDATTVDWQEMELAEKPFQNLQAVGDGERGLMFISPGGLHEGGVRDDRRRTLHVTLLRSFRRTVGTEGEVDGLELGRRAFEFAIMPFAGEAPAVEGLRQVACLQSGMSTRQSGSRPSGYAKMKAAGVAERSLLRQLDGTLVVSAIKPAEDGRGIVVRLWNPTATTAVERLAFERPPAAAWLCDLKEEATGEAEMVDGVLVATAAAKQIVSLRIDTT